MVGAGGGGGGGGGVLPSYSKYEHPSLILSLS